MFREHLPMRKVLAAAVLISALVLAACGGSSKSKTASVPVVPSPSTTTTTTAPTSTVATKPATTPSVTGSRCVASELALTFIGQQGATGHGEIAFALRNTTTHSCHTFGYPGVLFLGRGGLPLPTSTVRTTRDLAGAAPVRALTLAPGASASFRLFVTHGINSSAGCQTADGLQVIPPDDTATLRATIPGGAYQCRTATVTPLQPGNSAFR